MSDECCEALCLALNRCDCGVVGWVRVHGMIANPLDYDLKLELYFLVDTGTIYTLLAKCVADKIGLKELGQLKFKTVSRRAPSLRFFKAFLAEKTGNAKRLYRFLRPSHNKR